MTGKPKVRIEQWLIVNRTLFGNVYGHPNFTDGQFVKTSIAVEIPTDPQYGTVVETRNTLYSLGQPCGTVQG